MSPLLQTSWPVAALFIAQKFVLAEAVLLLALCRALLARGASRLVALLAALAAAWITATVFAPALGLTGAAWYPASARALTSGGGLGLPLSVSVLFAVSALVPGRRAMWIDVLHALVVAAVLGLWAVATLT
ncbi:hypothetical protein [Roseivivax sediminis]|uniref:Uncharacterized protein n=1 Tax=Roseivivax sediminis TaxID=936889 RepID=A0A1I1YFW3_9RHOB|nr:hypothetical protein [Roseivivax sediminis]SFE18466.1 hypothetical protein SAMN04515678_10732 [Roseivivax sediminis]